MARRAILLLALICICGCSDSGEVQLLRIEVQALKGEVEELKAKAADDVQKANSELTALRRELETLRTKSSADLQMANHEITLLKEQMASLQQEDMAASEEPQGLDKASDEAHNLFQLARRKLELDELDASLLQVKDDIVRQETDVKRLTGEIDRLNDQIATIQNETKKLQAELETGAESFEFAGKKFTAKQVEEFLEARFNACKVLESSLAERERESQHLRSLLAAATDDLKNMESRRDTRQSEFEELYAASPVTAADRLMEAIENSDGILDEEALREMIRTLHDADQPAEESK